MIRNSNVMLLEDTLKVMEQGYYVTEDRRVPLKLTREERLETVVLLPDDLEHLEEKNGTGVLPCRFSTERLDSFTAAQKLAGLISGRVLVLNFANPVNPGGGVRHGAVAQEEDLCRKSSLLLSLESEAAKPYFAYNKTVSWLGSDAMILTPNVEIIRDAARQYLPEPFVVSVLTCAAPVLPWRSGEIDENEYEQALYRRIGKILLTAANYDYRDLVLGAWGCGVFGNDAALVSDLFQKAFRELLIQGTPADHCFSRVVFAIPWNPSRPYNFLEFARNFPEQPD